MAWYSSDDGQTWKVARVYGQHGTQTMDAVVVTPDGSLTRWATMSGI